jgi:hypothetical protein
MMMHVVKKNSREDCCVRHHHFTYMAGPVNEFTAIDMEPRYPIRLILEIASSKVDMDRCRDIRRLERR